MLKEEEATKAASKISSPQIQEKGAQLPYTNIEIRISKSEIHPPEAGKISKSEFSKFKTGMRCNISFCFLSFIIWSFEVVSNFEILISDLPIGLRRNKLPNSKMGNLNLI